MEQMKQGLGSLIQQEDSSPQKEKLPASAHVLCGWPLLLVAIGGAIGGGLGGAAYGINVTIYKSKMPVILKIILNLSMGSAAVAIWLSVGMAFNK